MLKIRRGPIGCVLWWPHLFQLLQLFGVQDRVELGFDFNLQRSNSFLLVGVEAEKLLCAQGQQMKTTSLRRRVIGDIVRCRGHSVSRLYVCRLIDANTGPALTTRDGLAVGSALIRATLAACGFTPAPRWMGPVQLLKLLNRKDIA
jgi:hypothetical protein